MAGRKNKNIMWELPPEILLFQILPKLPAKSFLRFKCVCKQWQSFLTTPMFTKIQLHNATHHSHEKLLFLEFNSFPLSCNFQTIDCEGGSISTPRSYPFRGAASIITSFVNGLVCVGISGQPFEFSDVILWNPLTGEYKTISRPIGRKSYNFRSMRFELYYTCNDDDYKILLLSRVCDVYIYSLKFDSWRMVESTYDNHERIPYAVDHNMLDEKLHYLWQRNRSYIIIRLDLKTEKLTKIAVPSTGRHGCLKVVRGCIQLTFFNGQCGQWTIEVWQMDGDGDWTKLANTSSRYHIRKPLTGSSAPLYLTWNGNWLVHCTSNIICKVDPEKNTIDEIMCSNYNIFIHRRGTYFETLVSPNQYVN